MNSVRNTFLEFALIGVLGIVAAIGYNTIRAGGRLKLTKNYFDKGPARPGNGSHDKLSEQDRHSGSINPGAHQSPVSAENTGLLAQSQARKASPSGAPTAAGGGTASRMAPDKPQTRKHLVHDYHEIEFNDLLEIVTDPQTSAGLNLVIDARSEERFAEGHIPGAKQCSPFEVEKHIDGIEDAALVAEKVIVYCGGGDCQDSIFMCRELVELNVPYDAIYLYEGGWKDWQDNSGPIAVGLD